MNAFIHSTTYSILILVINILLWTCNFFIKMNQFKGNSLLSFFRNVYSPNVHVKDICTLERFDASKSYCYTTKLPNANYL